MFARLLISTGFLCSALYATPALAGRTAIDEDGNGNSVKYSLSGYCDINGDDCGGGLELGYQVSFGGGEATSLAAVHGNGILSFGSAFQFLDNPEVTDTIFAGSDPALTAYGLNLVTVGQNNLLDMYGEAFQQGGSLRLIQASNAIRADWFTCNRPSGPDQCKLESLASLTLTPTRGGFNGLITGTLGGAYVIDGVQTNTGQKFFLPANITGLEFAAVPEPASWALMLGGFGLAGAALRRRRPATIRVTHA